MEFNQKISLEAAVDVLKHTFGYDEFRLDQAKVIESVLKKQDTLAIMPTGGGKSICYQIPALLFEGLTVVISPLISLMQDQIDQLKELGISCAMLNSSLDFPQYLENMDAVRQNMVKLLYVAPETLLLDKTLNLLSQVKVDCITIDEAHCISEWGHDFRPQYRRIIETRKQFKDAVCLALTATATPQVREDIRKSLALSGAKFNEYVSSFDRSNLFIKITTKIDPQRQAEKFLKAHANQSGIIYCSSRKQVDKLSALLAKKGFSVKGYHAGLSDAERALNQELFRQDEIQIIVSTIAFGMGINKSNVRFVLHYDLPKNIESYYQQIGRAGRDGLEADCLLLFSYGDIHKVRYFISQMSETEQELAKVHLRTLLKFCEAENCRRIPLLGYFGETYSKSECGMCDNCLSADEPLVDLSEAAQKFLSCVKRVDESFGVNHIIDVLRGSKAAKVLQFGHDKISTYGIGKDVSKAEWQILLQLLMKREMVWQDQENFVLKLRPKAWAVLKGEERLTMKVSKLSEHKELAEKRGKGPSRRGKAAKSAVLEGFSKDSANFDDDLFDNLRSLRSKLAKKAGVPPYIIFSDKTLVEMAATKPQNHDDMLDVNGVGDVKWERYGQDFLDVITKNNS